MDYSIIGGGITGVYLAYKLIEKGNTFPALGIRNISEGNTVTIYEINNRLGGRILTERIDDYWFNMGAARYLPSEHKLLVELITKLKLPTNSYIKSVCECVKYRELIGKLPLPPQEGNFLSVASEVSDFNKEDIIYLARLSGYTVILDNNCSYELGYGLITSVLRTDYETITGGMDKLITELVARCGNRLKIVYNTNGIPLVSKLKNVIITIPLSTMIDYGYYPYPDNRFSVNGRKIGYTGFGDKFQALSYDYGQLRYGMGILQYQTWTESTRQYMNFTPKSDNTHCLSNRNRLLTIQVWPVVAWFPSLPLEITYVTINGNSYPYLSNDVCDESGWINGSLRLVDTYMNMI